MKQIKLMRLMLSNFKGIENFTLEANGKDLRIFGDNATGKTTLFDAFIWLLFNKDSQNKAEFGIKMNDASGNAIHNLQHEVAGSFMIDGQNTVLRKVYAEKWTKQRGSTTSEFSGHTTSYFIDGVPAPKKEYDELVDSFIDEDVFKLLTSPTYFSEQLHLKKRREILLEVCGDISDTDVISSNKKLSALPDILGNRTIEKHRIMIAARRTEINKELEKLPIQINESRRSIPDTSVMKESEIKVLIDKVEQQIVDKQAELSRIQNGGEVAVKQKRLSEIEGELQQLKNQLQGDSLQRVSNKRAEISRIQRTIDDLRFEIDTLNRQVKGRSALLEEKKAEDQKLREKWVMRNGESFENHTHDENCPSCGQSLPAEQIEEAVNKAEAAFNLKKSEDLLSIRQQGEAATAELKRLNEENNAALAKVEVLNLDWENRRKDLVIATGDLEELEDSVTDVESSAQYKAKKLEIETVTVEINTIKDSSQQAEQVVRDEISALRTEESTLRQDLAKIANTADIHKRISDLEVQEKALAIEYEKLERELFLTEEFTRTKVEMLESKINSKFKLARFKLFREQVNGGIEEMCEAMYNGVPYGTGLNSAARTNVGLDIINTLSDHYKIAVPIFVDNAESVVTLIDTVGQKVSLVVSEGDRKLRVETPEKKVKEAV